MMTLIEIGDLDLPNLRPYRTLRRSVDHQRGGIFVAEGEKVVRRLVQSNLEIRSLLLTPEWLAEYRTALESRSERLDVFVAKKELLNSIVGFHLHQGIMAVARIPRPPSLETVVGQAKKPFLFAAVDGLTNSENLGVLVRNCAAFGVQGLFVGETSSSPYLRRAVRNSMGTVFQIPVLQCSSLVDSLATLRSRYSVVTLAAHPRGNRESLSRTDFSRSCCVVFGSEGEGISKEVLKVCDEPVSIPMKAGVDSLNVASASAVVLYEVRRQRGMVG